MEKLIFRNKLAIGDNLVFTAALREMHKQYPNRYQTGVLSYYPEVYENNPYVANFSKEEAANVLIIDVNYSHDFKSRQLSGKHFANGYVTNLNHVLNLNIDLTDCRPEMYVTDQEIETAKNIIDTNNINSYFWLLAPAIKQDIPLKNYSAYNWQNFANIMKDCGVELVQTGDKTSINPRLKNIKSLVGKLNLREYFAIASLSSGMVGHVSLQTHLAAALNKPCITINGGRENINWYCYPNQQFLHTVGMLDCCHLSGCWLRTIQECKQFDYQNGISRCMQLIDVFHIASLVMKYKQ